MFPINIFKLSHNLLTVVLPFVLFILHSCFFINWIIDDAGISFAYSRSLAYGHGLVSQPGMNPVEGFSNFSWVLLMSIFFMTKTFDPIITPKLVSFFLVLLSFITISKALKLSSKYHSLGSLFILSFLALNTAFVVWTTSGLENPLLVFLVSLILYQIMKFYKDENDIKPVIHIAILSAICALTRPDGILYSAAFPILAYIKMARPGKSIRYLAVYGGLFFLIAGSYIAFRYTYFGDVFPNTYYAKGEALSILPAQWLPKMVNILVSLSINPFFASCLVVMFIFIIINKSNSSRYETLIIYYTMLLIATLIYILLPGDWMGEFRFATPFFLFFYAFIFLLGEIVYEKAQTRKITGTFLALLIIFFAISSTLLFWKRSITFANSPTVPFTLVAEQFGTRFDNYAVTLGIENGSVLLPDLGGTLYYSNLKVYDLAGLTDKVIGKSLVHLGINNYVERALPL